MVVLVFDYISGHAGLPDIDSELEQLSVDPRRTPQRIGDAHLCVSPVVQLVGHHDASTSSANTI
jgi:hypothetical protein